jgi:DNA end-binding protein Ku
MHSTRRVLLHAKDARARAQSGRERSGLARAERLRRLPGPPFAPVLVQEVGHRLRPIIIQNGASGFADGGPESEMEALVAPRPVGNATISFGLVSIPVRFFTATQASSGVSFNMLHNEDGGRLKQHYTCVKCEKVVPRDATVKGYEFAKDQYVQFTPDELKALEEKATGAIEITEFVPGNKIDPIYYEKTYYLGPEKGGERAYRLLAAAMRKTGMTALARYAARGKQHLVQLRPLEDGLVMQQLLYADEVRPFSEVPREEGEVKEPELLLATQIVGQIATDQFKPEQYKDDVRERILSEIEKKVQGKEISIVEEEPKGAQIVDLMEALKASIAASGARSVAAAPAPASAASEPPAEAEAPSRKPARRAPRSVAPAEKKAGKK